MSNESNVFYVALDIITLNVEPTVFPFTVDMDEGQIGFLCVYESVGALLKAHPNSAYFTVTRNENEKKETYSEEDTESNPL